MKKRQAQSDNPIASEKEKVLNRIIHLRKCILINPTTMGLLLNMRRQTYTLLEKGEATSIDMYLELAEFYKMPIFELLNYNNPIEDEEKFRRQILNSLIKEHPHLKEKLSKKPPLKMVIEYRLIEKGFFNQPKQVKDVSDYLKNSLNYDYSDSISDTINKFVDAGILQRKLINEKDYEYFKK